MARDKVVVNSETLALMMVDYEGGMNLRDVGDKYGMSNGTARRILEEAGVEIKAARGGRAFSNPVCVCGYKNPHGSKFCCMCGKSLKSEEEKIIDGLLDARGKLLQYAPDSIRKETDSQIMRAVKLLKEKCGVQ